MSNDFGKSVFQSIQFANENNLLYQAGCPSSLIPTDNFKKMSLKANSYRELYDCAICYQDFNLMLFDKSFFQFSEMAKEQEVRLAYFPNPYSFSESLAHRQAANEMLERSEISLDEFEQIISEETFSCDIPIIRYDLSQKQYCEMRHPTAHFHIGFFSENRWPSRRVMTPMSFFLKVLRLYYSGLWDEIDQKQGNCLDELYRTEIAKCPLVTEDYFSKTEAQRFFFT
ncbi:MAG: DUF2290 domain-containing protein [Gammaproteobacteria bacterium]|nr:DUF2290 domain-containing protein [Gammaproteobacteria bacterium]MBU1556747.1 DUF2290 domain-containing protein [Gammaproteobacteria bacterium]MBU2070026.1 DUF2290 domain-containing protein [Gammaproteobacteria bacterium]MBU2183678.1 DUF2290 domain-containing protein [Gammaproteobacteria bacterium]MBU2205560.1 DUF2290 domain-containing protein [Gammaproteobacteria bacterium]